MGPESEMGATLAQHGPNMFLDRIGEAPGSNIDFVDDPSVQIKARPNSLIGGAPRGSTLSPTVFSSTWTASHHSKN